MAKAKSQKSRGVRTVYNRATGQHEKKKAYHLDTTEWWRRKLFGGAPRPLRERKQDIDKEVEQAQ